MVLIDKFKSCLVMITEDDWECANTVGSDQDGTLAITRTSRAQHPMADRPTFQKKLIARLEYVFIGLIDGIPCCVWTQRIRAVL